MTKSLIYIMSGKLINTYYQDLTEIYLTTINPKKKLFLVYKRCRLYYCY